MMMLLVVVYSAGNAKVERLRLEGEGRHGTWDDGVVVVAGRMMMMMMMLL